MAILVMVGFICREASKIHIGQKDFHIMVRNWVALDGSARNIQTVSRGNG